MERLSFVAVLLVAANAVAGIAYRFEGVGSGRVIAEGANIRVEYLQGERVTSVLLSNDGGKTVTLLDPARKTFTSMNIEAMLGDITLEKSKATARDLGDGGTIEGFPTRHWVVDASSDVVVGDVTVYFTMHSESWRTERIPTDAQLKGTRFEKLLSAETKGFPLKEITTLRSKPANGRETTTTVTAVVHDVRRVTTTPAQFAIPPGYKRKQ